MALLSQMIRASAITGRPDQVHAWFATRQGGRWADQTIRAAMPSSGSYRLRELTDLHRRGVLTDAEFATMRSRLGV